MESDRIPVPARIFAPFLVPIPTKKPPFAVAVYVGSVAENRFEKIVQLPNRLFLQSYRLIRISRRR